MLKAGSAELALPVFLSRSLSGFVRKFSDVSIWLRLSGVWRNVGLVQSSEGPMPRHSPYTILLSENERTYLAAMAAKYTAPYFEVVRAKIVLYAAEGMDNQDIAARLDLPRHIVSKGRKRFYNKRLLGLVDDVRSGRPPRFSPSGRRRRKSVRV
jgi:hypothetical protein